MISVIVPVYNVCKYLNRCIQSILSQTYKDFEIILVDDGSVDGSEILCDEFAKLNKCIITLHQKNQGLSAARNNGIKASEGEYIAFVDSDDYVHERMLEILYGNLKEYDADLSVCGFWKKKEDELIAEGIGENETECFEGSAVMQQLFEKDLVTIVVWNKLYKRHLFNNLRFREGKLHEDEYIIHSLLYECKRTVYTECKLYYYMQHAGTITTSPLNRRRLQDTVQAYVERVHFFDAKRLQDCFEKTFEKMIYVYTDYYQKLEIQNTPEKEELQKWLLQDMNKTLKEYGKNNPYSDVEYFCYLIWSSSPLWGGRIFYLREKCNLCVSKLKTIFDRKK